MAQSVNPKRVLHLINNMGYKNVSATELKDFKKDLKKLIKYEQKTKSATVVPSQVIRGPENVINVTIIKESSPKKCDSRPATTQIPLPVQETNVEKQPDEQKSEKKLKSSKKLLRLPKHIKTKNPKIIRKEHGNGLRSGVLVRNTPTDLYQKYQEDWVKFKSYIPGENSRQNVRKSVRLKLQHKDGVDAKVYVHFPDEKGDQ